MHGIAIKDALFYTSSHDRKDVEGSPKPVRPPLCSGGYPSPSGGGTR